jgi:hypothetical protein
MATKTVSLSSATALLTSAALSAQGTIIPDTWDCTLAWDASTSPNLKGYIIKWGINHSYATGKSDVITGLEYTITGIPFDTTWYAVAVAIDNYGIESVPSNEIDLFRPRPPLPPSNASTVTIQISLNATDTKALTDALNSLYGSPATLKHYIKLKL